MRVTSRGQAVDLSEKGSGVIEGRGHRKERGWAWREKAIYQDIGLGFDLGK